MYRQVSLNISFIILFMVFFFFFYEKGDIVFYNQSLLDYAIGIDGLSAYFIGLTSLLIVLCILVGWNIKYKIKEYLCLLFLIEFCLINVFCIFDLFLFYAYFESILIPMFLLIGIWGSRERKVIAAYQFFIYTLLGSLFMLVAILSLYYHLGSCDIRVLQNESVSYYRQIIICLCFLIGFAVKVPMFPVHLWLPEAHVEASTPGSVILAGVLLKLGTYGILRFMLPAFPGGSAYWAPLIFVFSLVGIIYSSCATIRQVDLKKIVAYSSIAHMNFVMIGLFSMSFQSIEGSIIVMLSHGLVSSGLFICVGFLYDRYKTKILFYYGGLMQVMPIFSGVFLILILSNLSFPGTSSFVGELLILVGVFINNTVVSFISSLTIVLSAGYSLWFFNRICCGMIKAQLMFNYSDLTKREICILIPLVILIFCIGFKHSFFSEFVYLNVLNIVEIK